MSIFQIIIFLFCTITVVSASEVDTVQLRIQCNKAIQLSERKEIEEASLLAKEILQSLEKMEVPLVEIKTKVLNVLGDCDLDVGNYTSAIAYYEQAKVLLEKHQLLQSHLMADVLNKIGNFYREIKSYKKALDYLRQSLQLREKLVGKWHLKVADVLVNLGICSDILGDTDRALDFHHQALAIRKDLLPNFHPKIAQCYNNIALCLVKKESYEEAIYSYKNAIKIYSAAFQNNHPDLADVYLNLGNAYGEVGQIDIFIQLQNQALQIWENIYNDHHPIIALAINNLANGYHELGDQQLAFELYEKALKIRLKNYGPIHPDVAESYFNIGLSHFYSGNWEKALSNFKDCMAALNYRPGLQTIFEQVNDPVQLLQLLGIIYEVEVERYNQSGAKVYLLNAFHYLEQADLLIDFLRISYETSGSKLMLVNSTHNLYDAAIEIALSIYELDQDEKFLKKAFQFSEKSKGVLLLEAFKQSDAESFSGIPDATITKINQLETGIALLEKKRFLNLPSTSTSDDLTIDTMDHSLFQQKEELSQLIKNIEQDYPAYYNLRYATSTLSIDWIQEHMLTSNQSIVAYFLGNNNLRIFVVNKNDFQVHSIPIAHSFFQAVEDLHFSIKDFPHAASTVFQKRVETYASTAYYLYTHLIEPVKSILKEELIVIPDGVLNLISFGALLSHPPDSLLIYKDYPYLIQEYTISYNYSCNLLKEMLEGHRRKGLKPYLGFAPEFTGANHKGLSPLKYNQKEILHVRQKIGGRVFSNKDANKTNFINHQNEYKIIHLATHGTANNAFGDYSFLAFSETPTEKGGEELLYVREIYNLTTYAEMIVLSACETGTGKLQLGEGVASIARSFSYAGAKSLIATQWSVEDKATGEIVSLFFDNIKLGLPKDRALQSAKLSFIKSVSQKFAHPFYWASFIPIGNMTTLDIQNTLCLPFYFAIILVLLLLIWRLFIVFRKKLTK